jgi:hypothetical protein
MVSVKSDHDTFVADSVVAQELGVSTMTLWRYDHDDKMISAGWPAKIVMGRRNYRSRKALEDFKANLLRRAISARKHGHSPNSVL